MPFVIGRGFAEVQALRKWNCVDYFDDRLHIHWYWHDLAKIDCQIQFCIDRGKAEDNIRIHVQLV